MSKQLIQRLSDQLEALSLIVQLSPDIYGKLVSDHITVELQYTSAELEPIARLVFNDSRFSQKWDLRPFTALYNDTDPSIRNLARLVVLVQ